MDNKKICTNCGIEKNENHYYRSRMGDNSTMDVCKDCFKNEIADSKDMLLIFRKYNVPFLADVWVCDIGKYMKTINSLPQYSYLQWKDSIMDNPEQKEEPNFYDGIVKTLKQESNKLSKIVDKLLENRDMNNYIATIKSLRETLDLISKYDWKLMYSEYKTTDNIKHVSIWEQNHDNQIRNHKIWTVSE